MFIQLLSVLFTVSAVFAYNMNLPYSAFNGCKEYRIDGQYLYRDAFTILGLKNNRPYDNEVFRMKLYVFAEKDANILISNEQQVQDNDRAYEIGKILYIHFFYFKYQYY